MNIEEIEIALKGAKYNHYGLSVIEIDGAEYAVARSAEEAYAAACKAVGESLWAFDPEFILSQCGIYFGRSATEAFGKMLSNVCEEGERFRSRLDRRNMRIRKFLLGSDFRRRRREFSFTV